MVPNPEVLENVKNGKTDALSQSYQKICDEVFAYAMESPNQQEKTTKGTLFGAYNAVTGYFQNTRNYKNQELKFKSIMEGIAKLRGQTAFDLCGNFAQHGESVLLFN